MSLVKIGAGKAVILGRSLDEITLTHEPWSLCYL